MTRILANYASWRNVQQVSEVESSKKTDEFSQNNALRVRDVSNVVKQFNKHPKLFKHRAVKMTSRNQRQAIKKQQGNLLKAIADWHGFIDRLPEIDELDDASLFVLESVYRAPYLYPKEVSYKLRSYLEKAEVHFNNQQNLEVNAEIIQSMISKENVIANLLTIFNLCRCYDKNKIKFKKIIR